MPETLPVHGARRSDAISIARVICILGVIYVHAWTGLNGEMLASLRGSTQDDLRWTLMEIFGRSAVPLLGLISGWLVAASGRTRDWTGHIARKARTILLPMILWNMLAILFVSGAAWLFGLSAPQPRSLWWVVDEVLILTRNPDINVQMPFLRDLFLCMVAAPLLVRLPDWTLGLIVILAGAAHIAGLGPPVLMRVSILFFFVLGILTRRHAGEEWIARLPLPLALLPFALLMAAQLYRTIRLGDGEWLSFQRSLDLAVRVSAAIAFWRLAWALAGSVVRGLLLRLEPFAFFFFCAHLILIWLGGPVLGAIFGPMGSSLYPIYLIAQPFVILAAVIPAGLALQRIAPGAASILSGGRLRAR
ncbi:acyltransferase [Sphingobium sp. BYY-5]|uniref:acyltransferase family protein n=1 Tax=Sphingobium sp. BYY-5 TaxID=2926400 RepID=UPI001FA700E3|nr:acyltransferase family protein [Sphingobium sp. BYY-5]MCI4590281.1 acyltransferase [Sphingobium sp. BYY-5]